MRAPDVPDAAKCQAFLASLPETIKFEVQEANYQRHELKYDALKQRVNEIARGAEQSNKARQQLIS